MKNKILERRQALEATIETLTYKLKHLQQHFSKPQIRCWKHELKLRRAQLKMLPTEKQIQRNAKRINYSNSTRYWYDKL